MFPNDQICNIRAAKSAARRIFEKYGMSPTKQSQSSGLGQQQVSGLIKNAYQAINIPYDPSLNDVSSFMSVFGVDQNGKIQLDKLQQLAIKYLCGQEALIEQKNNPQKRQNEIKNEKDTITRSNKQKPNIQISSERNKQSITNFTDNNNQKQISSPKSKGYNFKILTPRISDSKKYFSSNSKQTSDKNSNESPYKMNKKLSYSQILNKANQIFNENKNKQKCGITIQKAGQVLSKTYNLIGKMKFNPSQQDIKIWMKLCDIKRTGVVEWVNYQNFVKRLMQRQNIQQDTIN